MARETGKHGSFIAFKPLYVRIAGSRDGALVLIQAAYWSSTPYAEDGWFSKTRSEWTFATTLNPYEQRTIRKNLSEIKAQDGTPLWEEKFVGSPPKMYYRVNLDVLDDLIDNGYTHPKMSRLSPKNTQALIDEIKREGTEDGTPQDDQGYKICTVENPNSSNLQGYKNCTPQGYKNCTLDSIYIDDPTTKIKDPFVAENFSAELNPFDELGPPPPDDESPVMEAVASPDGERPSRRPKKTTTKTKEPKPYAELMASIIEAYVTRIGYTPVNFGPEAKAAQKLAQAGYTPEQVVGCFEYMKGQPFWNGKHISLMSIGNQIGAYLTDIVEGKNKPNNGRFEIERRSDEPTPDWVLEALKGEPVNGIEAFASGIRRG